MFMPDASDSDFMSNSSATSDNSASKKRKRKTKKTTNTNKVTNTAKTTKTTSELRLHNPRIASSPIKTYSINLSHIIFDVPNHRAKIRVNSIKVRSVTHSVEEVYVYLLSLIDKVSNFIIEFNDQEKKCILSVKSSEAHGPLYPYKWWQKKLQAFITAENLLLEQSAIEIGSELFPVNNKESEKNPSEMKVENTQPKKTRRKPPALIGIETSNFSKFEGALPKLTFDYLNFKLPIGRVYDARYEIEMEAPGYTNEQISEFIAQFMYGVPDLICLIKDKQCILQVKPNEEGELTMHGRTWWNTRCKKLRYTPALSQEAQARLIEVQGNSQASTPFQFFPRAEGINDKATLVNELVQTSSIEGNEFFVFDEAQIDELLKLGAENSQEEQNENQELSFP